MPSTVAGVDMVMMAAGSEWGCPKWVELTSLAIVCGVRCPRHSEKRADLIGDEVAVSATSGWLKALAPVHGCALDCCDGEDVSRELVW